MLAPAVVQEAIAIARDLLGESPLDDAVRVVRDYAHPIDPAMAGQMIARIHDAQHRYYGKLMEEPTKGDLSVLTSH